MKSPAVLATTFEFFCLLLGDMVFQAVLYLLYLAPMSEAAKSNWATAFAYGLSLITLIMLLTWVVPRDEVKTALKRSTKFWREVWLVAIVFPLTVVVSGFVADRLSGPLQLTNNQQDVVHLIGASPLLPMLLLVAVIGPIMEETYFRGVLLNRFKQSGQLWLGVLFSAFWFAIDPAVPVAKNHLAGGACSHGLQRGGAAYSPVK